ncbi:uncharacterized protein [Aegilops tauschii subsp. strangulata]|uniref:uncharacterized protein n=1 Tax=Aegilops tauschii subsp. strangulata TaxID=200361 RepID=UPI001ABD1A98|nr:uncharacterized protein LOC120975283 [Aegilops tauschii subsp. strangulata]
MAPSCWFFWALWLPLMLPVATAEEQVQACSAKKCGNTTISDPFWLTDMEMGRSCGSPDFEVDCYNGSSPVLLSPIRLSARFDIINISYEERSLRVADRGKLNLLQASNSCQVPIWNTSVKVDLPFRISPVNLNLMLYNCTEATAAAALRRGTELVRTRMRCVNETRVFVRAAGRYDGTSGYGGYAVQGCIAAAVPVLGRGSSSGEANASDYEQLINDGFLMTWDPPPTRKFTSQILSLIHFLASYLTKLSIMALTY